MLINSKLLLLPGTDTGLTDLAAKQEGLCGSGGLADSVGSWCWSRGASCL